jgi:hypothetical protein
MAMRLVLRNITSRLTLLALASSLFVGGCAVQGRVYDPYYHDYHSWPAENTYYLQWEGDTHRNHEDLKHRSKADQKAYWDWRHQNESH